MGPNIFLFLVLLPFIYSTIVQDRSVDYSPDAEEGLHSTLVNGDFAADNLNEEEEEYNYKIEYDKKSWEGVESPKCGLEIDLVEVQKVRVPNQIRLSYTGDPIEMSITWTTRKIDHINRVRYGLIHTHLNYESVSVSHQYKWLDSYTSGFIHEALMINLVPGMIHYYQIESHGVNTTVKKFIAAPSHGSDSKVSFFHIGDVGVFGTSVMVTSGMMRSMRRKDFHGVIHCGDIAYVDGYKDEDLDWGKQELWDTWGYMVEPVTSTLPYMVTPGNHELDMRDSARENATIYSKRFMMPGNERYYSFGVGMVHFVAVSTDESIDPESTQGKWLNDKLEYLNTKRDTWPWIVTFQHRPIYNSNRRHGIWEGQDYNDTKEWEKHGWVTPEVNGWPDDYNNMLIEHRVDLVLNGHVHHYERTWPVKSVNETFKSYDGQAPVHITCGHGGKSLYRYLKKTTENSYIFPAPEYSAERNNTYWGHCELDFIDRYTVQHRMYEISKDVPTVDVVIKRSAARLFFDQSLMLATLVIMMGVM